MYTDVFVLNLFVLILDSFLASSFTVNQFTTACVYDVELFQLERFVYCCLPEKFVFVVYIRHVY